MSVISSWPKIQYVTTRSTAVLNLVDLLVDLIDSTFSTRSTAVVQLCTALLQLHHFIGTLISTWNCIMSLIKCVQLYYSCSSSRQYFQIQYQLDLQLQYSCTAVLNLVVLNLVQRYTPTAAVVRYHSLQPLSLLLNHYCYAVLCTPVPMAASTAVNAQHLAFESDGQAEFLKTSRETLVNLEAHPMVLLNLYTAVLVYKLYLPFVTRGAPY